MAFFTRKGLTVPEFPNDSILTEEPEEFNLPSTPSSLATPDDSTSRKSSTEMRTESKDNVANITSISEEQATSSEPEQPEQPHPDEEHEEQLEQLEQQPQLKNDQQQEPERYEYVVDRTYGVEV